MGKHNRPATARIPSAVVSSVLQADDDELPPRISGGEGVEDGGQDSISDEEIEATLEAQPGERSRGSVEEDDDDIVGAPKVTTTAPARSVPGAMRRALEAQQSQREEDGEVVVTPTLTINRMRIGKRDYSFTARMQCRVPAEVIPLLVERGIVAPSYHRSRR